MPIRRSRLAAPVLAAALLACGALASAADKAYFVRDGALVVFDAAAAAAGSTAPAAKVQPAQPISEFFGTDADGNAIVAIGHADIHDGYDIAGGVDIVALDDTGAVARTVATNALRAYPSPSGAAIAVVGIDFRVSIVRGSENTPLAFARPSTLVAWSPDEASVCLTAYPEDWTPLRANSPSGPDEFLRLQNSDLFLVALADGTTRQLTDAPGYDYSAVFAPGGASLFFISSRAGRGAFFSLDLATGAVAQLTNLEPGTYTVPVGRSDTFALDAASGRIAYEAQETHTTSSIRTLALDGTAPATLGIGNAPQLLSAGRIAYIAADGTVEVAAIAGKESLQ